ncbi:MAG TPA: hypothetical protein VNX02_11110 [Steroidobacteraceae bacterium]|nr:hypothetical protein [Steroidobacteraceae bacterium]
MAIERIDVELITRYIASCSTFRAKATVYRTLSTMRGFGDYLVRQGPWSRSPLRWMKGPKLTPRLPKRIDHEHMQALWREAGNRRGEFERIDVECFDRSRAVQPASPAPSPPPHQIPDPRTRRDWPRWYVESRSCGSSHTFDEWTLVIWPVHMIGVASEQNHTQRVVLFRTRRLRHHRLTPALMPGFAHHQIAKRFPQLRPPTVQSSNEIVMQHPRAAVFQLANTPELRDTLLPASHSSL